MRKYRFLVVNEDPNTLASIRKALDGFEGEVHATESWVDAIRLAESSGKTDLLIMSARIGRDEGPDLLREIRSYRPLMPVIVLTPSGQEPIGQECVRFGAEAWLSWPLDSTEFIKAVRQALRTSELEQRFEGLHYYQHCPYRPIDVLNSADILERALRWTTAADDRVEPILISGDTGTEKPFLAKALHFGGSRRNRRFVTHLSDCPSADGGTLFVDEVADLPGEAQQKLLAVIQNGVFDTGDKRHSIDVQVIAATRKDLTALASAGKFLPALADVLCTYIVRIPSLSERRELIPVLAERLSLRIAEEEGREPPRLTEAFKEGLKHYSWPGNLGELRSIIERAMLLAETGDLDTAHLPVEISGENNLKPRGEIIPFVEHEQAILKHALQVTGGKIPEAARRLNIGRATLYRKVKKYNLR